MISLTAREALRSLTAYPLPDNVLTRALIEHGLSGAEEFDEELAQSGSYLLASADVLEFLASAPNFSQGGLSFSLSSDERKQLRDRAALIRDGFGKSRICFGYKGSSL